MSSSVLFVFCFSGDVDFSEFYVPLPFPFWEESTLCVFLPDSGFLPCDHGLDFLTSAYVRIQSVNHCGSFLTIKTTKVPGIIGTILEETRDQSSLPSNLVREFAGLEFLEQRRILFQGNPYGGSGSTAMELGFHVKGFQSLRLGFYWFSDHTKYVRLDLEGLHG